MVKRILLGLIAAAVLFLVVVALQPPDFRIERSLTLQAPPAMVFEQVNDLHLWEKWSPWAKLDPTMKTVFAGPQTGEGATYGWVGNDDVGEGKMTIIKSVAPSLVTLRLEFLKPMEATNETTFRLDPKDQGTLVTWTMTGTNNFIGKMFALLMNVDKMVGNDFEKGLSQLKTIVETVKPKT